jgi:hypothetical protein
MGRAPSVKPDLALVPRIFAVLAAAFLVGSVALASLLPVDMTMQQAILALDDTWPGSLRQALVGSLGQGIWENLAVPVLARPVWLVPVCLGLICIGGAVTSRPHASPRTKQRRS